MRAYVFPGQGSQFVGMGRDLYNRSEAAGIMFKDAERILGFDITDLMFSGTVKSLRRTKVAQPAIFLYSVILAATMGKKFAPDMVAGLSLGEFSALVAAKALSFENGLRLVMARAKAMQKACNAKPSTMVAIMGLDANVVEETLASINEVVVLANHNGPEQLVISGSIRGVEIACRKLEAAGAHTAPLNVSGAFHSPLMEPARVELAGAINRTAFNKPVCPIYQNVDAKPTINPTIIRQNLIAQLTSPVLWHQTVLNMIADGARTFIEVGPGNVLQGLVRKIIKVSDVSGIKSISWRDAL